MHRLHSLTQLYQHPSASHLVELLGLLIVGAGIIWFLVRLRIPTLLSLGIALEVFSGNWKLTPVSVPLDRIVLALGVVVLILRGTAAVSDRRLVLRPIHFLLLSVTTYVVANALWAGTLGHSYGLYALLDRLGVIPFLLFTLAPLVFGTAKQRDILLAAMVILGLYLGFDALFEGAGIHALVFPHYINNQALGITQGRARGPFLAADAMGLSLFDCGVFAAIALTRWRRPTARLLCALVILLAALGIVFTLTRSVWLGSIAGLVVAMLINARLRRYLPVVLVVGALGVGSALVLVPGLSSKAQGRVDTQSSLWDRYNTNTAAIRAAEAHPLFGIGWQTFETKGADYLREAGTYPLTGDGLEVHNVFLSHLAELGLVGSLLWAAALFTGIGGAILRRGPPELAPWRLGLVAVFVMYLVVANLGPLSYPFPNLILWLMAGIVARDRHSVPRTSEELELLSAPRSPVAPVGG